MGSKELARRTAPQIRRRPSAPDAFGLKTIATRPSTFYSIAQVKVNFSRMRTKHSYSHRKTNLAPYGLVPYASLAWPPMAPHVLDSYGPDGLAHYGLAPYSLALYGSLAWPP